MKPVNIRVDATCQTFEQAYRAAGAALNALNLKADRKVYDPDEITTDRIKLAQDKGWITKRKSPRLTWDGFYALYNWREEQRQKELAEAAEYDRQVEARIQQEEAKNRGEL